MKISNFILIFVAFILNSCEVTNEKEIKGITFLNKEWTKAGKTFWRENLKDSTWTKIEPADTLNINDYYKCQAFELRINEKLKIEKLVMTDEVSKNKTSETDIYSKQLNSYIKSELSIGYEYSNQEYFIFIYDSIGTNEKIKLNQAKLDSIYQNVELNNLELCGTAANEILWQDIPEFPIPRIIDLDSALLIIEQWKIE